MVDRKELLALSYYELTSFTGSCGALRYRIEKQTDDDKKQLLCTAWFGQFSYDNTPDDKKLKRTADFSEDGLNCIVDWLNERHKEGG